ncbi:MAG: hypothetical protein AAGK97_10935, partial [Bacteroidota bacterium]
MEIIAIRSNKPVVKKLPNITHSKIGVSTSEGIVIVELDDIIYCEASGSYTILHLRQEKKIVSSKTLKLFDH